jgi:hypothetical protein
MAANQPTQPGQPAEPRQTDWFSSDPSYRRGAGRSQSALFDSLSQLLYDRNQKYRTVDNARDTWATNRANTTRQTAESMAARGLGVSGVYKQQLDKNLGEAESQAAGINAEEQDIQNQYGLRDSMAGQQFTMDSITDRNYNALASIYGLFGQRGTQLGNAYTRDLGAMRDEAAARPAG